MSAIRIFAVFIILMFGFKDQTGDLFQTNFGSQGFHKVYVVKHTWHTGIVFSNNSRYENFAELKKKYPDAKFIEIGWGDYDFFLSDKASFGMAAKAILWPTKSVIHVFPYFRHPTNYFEESHIVELFIHDEGYRRILSFVNTSFAEDTNKQIVPVEGDNPVGGQFYKSIEKYHLFKTCNVWTAKALKSAGISILPLGALNSGGVMRQLKKQ